jgi:large subunit ribosomal protein L35
MPKMKSHTGAGKRVKVTGTGKIIAQQAGLRHNLEKKASKVTRRMTGTVELSKVDSKRIKKLLGR